MISQVPSGKGKKKAPVKLTKRNRSADGNILIDELQLDEILT